MSRRLEVDLVAEASPLGGLERWLDDPDVGELLVNAGCEVWVDRAGALERVGRMRPATLEAAIEHLLTPTGRRLDRSQPVVDARLADGSRLCAVIPPVAVDGPCLAIRRFAVAPLALERFTTPEGAALLRRLVAGRANLLISGATSAGKTTLLGTLAGGAAPGERIVVLEDTAELRLAHPHVVRLETRTATPDGVGEVTLADLLRAALRMRPDRLVVGEIRGPEAVHLLHALNTGHDGSLATVHANGAADALGRLASLVLQSTPNWPLTAVHDEVARGIDVVVHVARLPDGRRTVAEIAEVEATDGRLRARPLVERGQVVALPSRGRR